MSYRTTPGGPLMEPTEHYVGDACEGGHANEGGPPMTITPQPLSPELRAEIYANATSRAGMEDIGGGDIRALIDELRAAEQRIAELEGVLQSTHDHYCDEAWTSRGLHAPQCLNYHMSSGGVP